MSERLQEHSIPASTSSAAAATVVAPTPVLPESRHSTPQLPQSRELPPPPRPSRSASFSNILNPDDGASRRRKAAALDSPLPASTSLHVHKHGRQSPAVPGQSDYPQNRRILTPRSPSLHRAASMGVLQNPTGSIDAQQSPFLNARTYTAEPGAAGVPPMPAPRGYPSPSTIDHRTSGSTQDIKAHSPSISPRTSYIPHYGSIRSSPASATLPPMSAMQYSESIQDRQRMSIPISSAAGQNVYQMMTLQTTSGAVQVPVDVQAASRVADEKRKRNAGASARFRARRKEKEKESSSTIAKLEMQLKDLAEDVEFYRRERSYLAGIVLQVPGGDRHFPRPQSPRHRRPSMRTSNSGSVDYLSDDNFSRSPGRGRMVRRRTSTLSLAAPAPTAGPSYTPQHYDHQQYQQQQQQQWQGQHQQQQPHQQHPHQEQPHQQQQAQQHTQYPQHQQPQQPQQMQASLPGPSTLLPPMNAFPAPPTQSPSTQWQPYNRDERERPSDPRSR